MPIYEYQCKNCSHKFEKLVFGKEKIKCPKCQSGNLKKLLSTFSTVKGSSDSSGCQGGVCNLNCPSCRN